MEEVFELRLMEEVFERSGSVLDRTVSGRVIGTTREYPYFARGKGWMKAQELRVGDGGVLEHLPARPAVAGEDDVTAEQVGAEGSREPGRPPPG